MVRRNFHHKGRSFTRENELFEDKARKDGSHNTDEVKSEHEVLAVGGEEGCCKQNVHRQTGAAAHKRSHHDRGDTVSRTVNGARCHNGGNVAAETDNEGHEGLAGQTQSAHQAVHHEGRTGHVAGVFEDGQEEVQEEDHRDEGGDGLNTAADTVSEDHLEPFGAADAFKQLTEPVNGHAAHEDIEEVNEGSAEILREEEHHVHHEQEDRQTEPAVQNHVVDLVGDGCGNFAFALNRLFSDAGHKLVTGIGNGDIKVTVKFLVQGFDDGLDGIHSARRELIGNPGGVFHELHGKPVGAFNTELGKLIFNGVSAVGDLFVKLHGHRRHEGLLQEVADGALEFLNALIAGGNHTDHRALQKLLKRFQIDLKVVGFGNIEHVHNDNHRNTHFD